MDGSPWGKTHGHSKEGEVFNPCLGRELSFMGMWSFYFLGKIYLYFRGYISFNLVLNFLFMLFLLLPVPLGFPVRRLLKVMKLLVSLVCAFLLLWYDSWLPPLRTAFDFLTTTVGPSPEYIWRFLIDAVNPWVLAALLAIFVFCFVLLRKHVTLVSIVIFFMAVILVSQLRELAVESEDPAQYLATFNQSESQRIIRFEQPNPEDPDFDIVLLHICSLSWDDLRTIGMDKDPFFNYFDILFTNFNSVTTYSNPAAIRLLQANCGQRENSVLYSAVPEECYLLDSLRKDGYTTFTALDHDGLYSHFTKWVMTLGKADPPLTTDGVALRQYDFDNSPIFDDLQILEKWWDVRQKSAAKRAALYFNAISLHSGSHRVDIKEWWKIDRQSHYKDSVQLLFKNIEKFFAELSSSGKNVVVVFVPEHGMALKGSRMQAPDLRDIPLPSITIVPVGIKFIGSGFSSFPANQEIISRPVSWMAVSYLLSSFTKESPFRGQQSILRKIIKNVPETPYVSDNDIKIIKKGKSYFLFDKKKTWTKLLPSALN
jgi:cellulose synthase operon protein YhjU